MCFVEECAPKLLVETNVPQLCKTKKLVFSQTYSVELVSADRIRSLIYDLTVQSMPIFKPASNQFRTPDQR